ncbi:mannose-1-phosphate guanylyltransferase [Marinifilum sp. RC60d5]|uniref:mannose-1-phosphate guanylyltransferase n=1 Tax=Marinifilum sp. RC60d5 TaxID=3458414 RepID=UPI004036D733
MNKNNYIVIMAGGIGSRFWPMSTEEKPKQFLDVLGIGKTLLQQTVARFRTIAPAENILIVTSAKYKQLVAEQCPELLESNILLEPCMRNTAPCIAYACAKIKGLCKEANMVVAPSDHLITKEEEFIRVIENGLAFTEKEDVLLTLGIAPHKAETGYGYIQTINQEELKIKNESVHIGSEGNSYETMTNHPPQAKAEEKPLQVKAFKEKPDLQTAKEYVEDGNYFWNAGIFLWSLSSISRAFDRHLPDLKEIFTKGKQYLNTDKEQEFIDSMFPFCPSISIDYGIMEKADNIFVQPADFGWSDLGTWGSLWEKREKNEAGNTVVGEKVQLFEAENCIVNMPKDKKVVIQGLQNYIVVEDNEVLLICKKEEEQRIKEFRAAVIK